MDTEPKDAALIDTRSEAEKAKDITFNEVVASAAPVNWVEKDPSEWRSFPIFNQGNSSSCVAQTLKKMLGIYVWLRTNHFVHLSASHIYQRRKNRPGEGMGAIDAFDIVAQGTTLEDFAPSENLSDSQMDNMTVLPFMAKIGEIFKIGKPIIGPTKDIETVASIIQQTEKAVMVWFYFSSGVTPKEWVDVPVIKYPNLVWSAPTGVARHSVTAVDFTLYQGKKALIVEDSWGGNAGMSGRRIVTEDFFKERNFFTAHFMNFAFEDQTLPTPVPSPRPKYDGVTIISLQRCLRYEGLFPTNIDFVEKFGPVTQKAVMDFQVRHGLHPTGVPSIGPLTKAKLHELYP